MVVFRLFVGSGLLRIVLEVCFSIWSSCCVVPLDFALAVSSEAVEQGKPLQMYSFAPEFLAAWYELEDRCAGLAGSANPETGTSATISEKIAATAKQRPKPFAAELCLNRFRNIFIMTFISVP